MKQFLRCSMPESRRKVRHCFIVVWIVGDLPPRIEGSAVVRRLNRGERSHAAARSWLAPERNKELALGHGSHMETEKEGLCDGKGKGGVPRSVYRTTGRVLSLSFLLAVVLAVTHFHLVSHLRSTFKTDTRLRHAASLISRLK